MRTERPTCRECACAKVCEYCIAENERNLDEKCVLEYWENDFVPKREWIGVDERLPTKDEYLTHHMRFFIILYLLSVVANMESKGE